jgi:cell division protein FtsZ
MAEFDEVGRTIENFASEDATVVIGTVLDPDMQDEVRVTVVATGLNRAVSRQPVRDRADFGMETTARKPQVQLIHSQGRRDGTTGMMLDEVDAYAASPNQGIGASLRRGGAEAAAPAVADFGSDSSYLDIPAFLRRQAD